MLSGKLGNLENAKNLTQDFVGRSNELAQIRDYFSSEPNGQPRVLVLRGIAGQGKAQIALEYCRQAQGVYRDIFWINATSDTTTIGSFEKIATELQLASSERLSDAAVKIRAVMKHLESWDERWLLVFDKYDAPEESPDTMRLIPSRTCNLILCFLQPFRRSRGCHFHEL
jgi:Cdc6-like AAA superfamily ATPase